MIPVRVKSLLLILVCARAASTEPKNDTVNARGFTVFGSSDFEQLDLSSLFRHYDEGLDNSVVNSSVVNSSAIANSSARVWPRNGTNITGPWVSDETLFFLRGPVSTILIPSFYTLVCLLSVPINICAVVAFASRIRPKKAAAIYMLNLACADLVFGLLLPFKIFYYYSGNNWTFGPLMCRVVTAAFYWNMYCSVLLVACISVDRLLAVVYPIDSLAWRRPRNAVLACASMWLLSLAGTVPLVLSEQTVYLWQLDVTTCHDALPVDALVGRFRIYFLTICCALFFLPLLVTVVSYARVIWSLSRVPPGVPGRSRRRARAVVMALTVLVMFLLCFTPTNCLLLVHYLQLDPSVKESQQAPDGSYAAYLVFMCLGSVNCLLDPLVYYFGSSQCQRELSSALRCRKLKESRGISHSSTDSCRSSSRAILKSSRTETSRINASDSLEKSLSSQYKKLLV